MSDKLKVKVRYLGAFADAARSKEERFELAAPTVSALIDYLVERHGEKFRSLTIDPPSGELRGGTTVLVNGERRGLQHKLSDGDEVTLLTPVAGGKGLETEEREVLAQEFTARRKRDNWPLLWLAVAAVLLFFSNGKWIIPVAAWLGPLFMVRFLRTQKPLRGLIIGYLVLAILFAIQWKGIIPLPTRIYYPASAAFAVVVLLPYLADRLMTPRLAGFASTLVLPVTWTVMEYANTQMNPYGSWASLSYSQYPNLPLLQVLSVTGLWGVTFIVVWFASVINRAWEKQFAWNEVQAGLLTYFSILGVILLLGGLRLTVFPPRASTVRVASLTSHDIELFPSQESKQRFFEGEVVNSELETIRAKMTALYTDLLDRSLLEARAGAKIILWPEADAYVFKEDEQQLVDRASQLARQGQVYVGLALCIYYRDPSTRPQNKPIENKMFFIDPTGEIAFTYLKAIPVPGPEARTIARGPRKIPILKTPYGRLGCAICYDMDFPQFIRQAGRNNVDIFFAPSNDWPEIDPLHTYMASYRAIENGFSLVRHTKEGLTLAVDYEGRTLTAMDHYNTPDRVAISQVPTKGTTTIYSRIGDFFAWLCIATFVMLVGKAIVRPKVE